MRLAAALGLVIGTLAAPASSRTFECSFQTLRACNSEIATFCPAIKGKELRMRIETTSPGSMIKGFRLQDGAWVAIKARTSDYQEMNWGRIFLLGSPSDDSQIIIVDKPTGAELELTRTQPTVAYTKAGRCTDTGDA